MRILWLTWKDKTNPLAGGAEVVASELGKRLIADGHEVIFLVGGYEKVESLKLKVESGGQKTKAIHEEIIDGYKVIRVGGRWTVYWQAYKYYKKNLKGWADVVVDEMNTIPFFASFYANDKPTKFLKFVKFIKFLKLKVYKVENKNGKEVEEEEKTNPKQPSTSDRRPLHIIFVHQLCREIWFYQMFFPLNIIGYFLETLYLRLLAFRFRPQVVGQDKLSTLRILQTFNSPQVITVSESTKKDLMKFGFEEKNINIISEGTELPPVEKLESSRVVKYEKPTILSLGAVRAMKRTDQIIKAFELIKSGKSELSTFNFKDFQLIIAGDTNDKFAEKILQMIEKSPFKDSIQVLGRVSIEKKTELMQKSHVLAVTSIKEGWGLVVTEAASQGTPAVVYDVDGLRDSVRHNETGLICRENSPESLAKNIERLLKKGGKYESMRNTAWKWSKEINFEKSYVDFKKTLNRKVSKLAKKD